jgi:hypothetical protein
MAHDNADADDACSYDVILIVAFKVATYDDVAEKTLNVARHLAGANGVLLCCCF